MTGYNQAQFTGKTIAVFHTGVFHLKLKLVYCFTEDSRFKHLFNKCRYKHGIEMFKCANINPIYTQDCIRKIFKYKQI